MPAPDFAKVQRNVAKMVDAGAPERDIDTYIGTERVTPAQLRAYGKRAKAYGAGDLVENRVTFGLADRVKALRPALAPDVSYSEALDTERAAREGYQQANPVISAATAPLSIFAGAPAATGMSTLRAAMVGGAAGGGAQGFAESRGQGFVRQAADTALGAGIGAAAGGVIARYAPAVVNRLAGAVRPTIRKLGDVLTPRTDAVQAGAEEIVDAADPRAAGRATLEAAKRIGVSLLPADVGGSLVRRVTAGTAQTVGAGPIVRGAKATARTAGLARDRFAASAGSVADEVGAGRAVQRGAEKFMTESAKRGSELYEAIPLDGNARSVLNNTRAALGELTEGFASNPKLSAMFSNGRLKGYLDALTPQTVAVSKTLPGGGKTAGKLTEAGGDLSWQDLKRFRSAVGEMAGEARFSDDTTRGQLQKLYGALSEDMKNTAAASGPKARSAFERANSFWRGREKRIDDTLGTILGENKDKSSQAVFEGIERLANAKGGDPVRLGRAMRSLPADEAATVRATIIDRLGRAKAGAQDETGDIFSPETFLTRWTDMSPRAKAVLFGEPKLRAGLDDLARVSAAVRETNKFTNKSQSGGAVNLGALGLLGASAAPAAIKLALIQYGSGKLLASQAFVNWLTRTPKVAGPKVADAVRAHVGQLAAVAGRDAAVRSEVLALQQRLTEAFSQPVSRLAAEQQDGPEAPEQPQAQGEQPRAPDPRERALSVRFPAQ